MPTCVPKMTMRCSDGVSPKVAMWDMGVTVWDPMVTALASTQGRTAGRAGDRPAGPGQALIGVGRARSRTSH